jgi:hypothetical protein
MKDYTYYLLADNDYGQTTLIKDTESNPVPQGEVKLSITTINKAVTDNIRYSEATYLGLTHDMNIKDTYVIRYGDELLKVLYVNPDGRYKQVFLGTYGYNS